jgi:hypothetical protein
MARKYSVTKLIEILEQSKWTRYDIISRIAWCKQNNDEELEYKGRTIKFIDGQWFLVK